MANKDILDKIQKLLALSQSNNPSEASIALNRAQKLMTEHNITAQDISLSSITSQKYEVKSYFRSKKILGLLANIVCKAFGVDFFYNYVNGKPRTVTLVGHKDRMDIAIYTITILQRQLEIERAKYKQEHEAEIKQQIQRELDAEMAPFNSPAIPLFRPKVMELFSNMMRMSEPDRIKRITSKVTYAFNKKLNLFLEGWLFSVNDKVMEFAMSNEEHELIATYLDKNFNLTQMQNRRQRHLTQEEINAFTTGKKRGKDGFNLYSAVNGQDSSKLTFQDD